MHRIVQRVLREPLLVGAANFSTGWVGLVFRITDFNPEPLVELSLGLGMMLLLLPLNVASARYFAGYNGKGSHVNGKLLAVYEVVGLLGIGSAWVINHAP